MFILNCDGAVHSLRRYVCLCLSKDFTWPMEGFLLPYAPPVKKPTHKKAVTTGNINLLKACRVLFILGDPGAVSRIGEKWRQSVLEDFGRRFSDATDRPCVSKGGAYSLGTWQCRTCSNALDNFNHLFSHLQGVESRVFQFAVC